MIIEESDFRWIPVDESVCSFDLELLYIINKGKKTERKEFKNVGYGLSLDNAILKIVMYRIKNKYETMTLRLFLDEFKKQVSEIKKLCS